MGAPKNLGVDTFPDPVSHFGAPSSHFGVCRLCGAAGSDQARLVFELKAHIELKVKNRIY